MKRIAIVLLIVTAAGLGLGLTMSTRANSPPGATPAGEAPEPAGTTPPPNRIVAYYFYTNYRCSSCRKIEAYSRTAIETGFAPELEEGRLVLRVVNVEQKGNEHYVKDYELYTKSLVLSEERSGHEERWKNLARVWELLGDEGAFVEYVQTETRAYLDDLP